MPSKANTPNMTCISRIAPKCHLMEGQGFISSANFVYLSFSRSILFSFALENKKGQSCYTKNVLILIIAARPSDCFYCPTHQTEQQVLWNPFLHFENSCSVTGALPSKGAKPEVTLNKN